MSVFLPANLALGKTAAQSSTDRNYYASYGADGIYRTNMKKSKCTNSAEETNRWWRVDLAQVEPVSEIYLVNRGDCSCADRLWSIDVRVGEGEQTISFLLF